jgi:hypothetical protein
VWKGEFGHVVGALIEQVAVSVNGSACQIKVTGIQPKVSGGIEEEKASGEVRFSVSDNAWSTSGDISTQYASGRLPSPGAKK